MHCILQNGLVGAHIILKIHKSFLPPKCSFKGRKKKDLLRGRMHVKKDRGHLCSQRPRGLQQTWLLAGVDGLAPSPLSATHEP